MWDFNIILIALEVQRNELEELSEKKLEHSLEERDAKHNLERIIDVRIKNSFPHIRSKTSQF